MIPADIRASIFSWICIPGVSLIWLAALLTGGEYELVTSFYEDD